jgi:hypothetical protein
LCFSKRSSDVIVTSSRSRSPSHTPHKLEEEKEGKFMQYCKSPTSTSSNHENEELQSFLIGNSNQATKFVTPMKAVKISSPSADEGRKLRTPSSAAIKN